MANRVADNAVTAGDLLVWQTAIGADTAVVYSYVCPVDSHIVVSPVRLGYANVRGSDGAVTSSTVVDTTPVCPLHDATLGVGVAKTVS